MWYRVREWSHRGQGTMDEVDGDCTLPDDQRQTRFPLPERTSATANTAGRLVG
jgi:hypothetical protein